ncbi:hypothetical protein [Clostridium swellfunianum]|uniref:hypothetical protein n=1 Tax=Clostridium swellfunianum TaxID=1367462 RepID=UPI00202E7DE2|nr:hypothetical protein [Clostridium swellfunianum]
MTLIEQLKEEYLKELQALISTYKKASERRAEEGSSDEAILETIKSNIGDIFFKLFNVSYRKACKQEESEIVELRKLAETYYDFFNKIPEPWREKMLKDKEHNMMQEYYIEQIKLETAEQVKKLFEKHFNRLCKEV